MIEVRELGPGDDGEVARAFRLFDDAIAPASTAAFLDDPRHHLLLAHVDGEPAGFVTAIELLHPDKERPEMFIYELAVDETHRRQGVASVLLKRLLEICHERGCREMFVLADQENDAALATYRRAHAGREPDPVMFLWTWPED